MSEHAEDVKAQLLDYLQDSGDGVELARKTDVPYMWILRVQESDMPLPDRVAERLAPELYQHDPETLPTELQVCRKYGVTTAANRRSLEYYLNARRERLRAKGK